jgi:tetratricopeptide (TPR) repeat protein/transcriptional regulator with XRE-family HTH domain
VYLWNGICYHFLNQINHSFARVGLLKGRMMMHTPKPDPQPRLRLTEARSERKWSQQDVADHIGTTHLNVSRWERGITKPGPYFRRRLCSLFGKSEQELDLESTPASSAAIPAASASTLAEALYDPTIPLQPAIRLVGRDDELTYLKQRLSSGGSVALTALNGLPGVGKTALAIELAHDHEIRAHFHDGILWAALGPEPNMLGLLSRWGTLLGISSTEIASLSDSEAWAIALRRAIGSRYMLLVIDDAWWVEDALTLKVGGPNCAHLVTTRFPNIATAVAADGATAIQELGEDESMILLRLLAPRVVDREEQKAYDLVHAVGGLPLALTLMGNYLRMQAYSGQARRIDTALQRLSNAEERLQISEPRGPVERHPSLPADTPLSLQSVFAVTDQQLDEQVRAALYALSVFPAKPISFAEEAALAVANCTVDALDTLFDAGLLESSISGRYTLHQTIADYARLHLEGTTAYERLITYFTGFVEEHKRDYELLEQESTIMLAALETAYELGWWAQLVRCTCAFAPFLLLRGIYAVAEQHLHRAYDAAMVLGDSYGITTTLLYLGQIALRVGNYAQAETYYQEGLTLAREMGDPERTSALLNDLGWMNWKQGDYIKAEAYLQEGLMLARQIRNTERITDLLRILGSVAANRGDYTQSVAYLQEGLVMAREMGDREQICTLLMNLGATVGEQGNYTQAEAYLQEGLVLARQIGQREQLCVLLGNLGEAAVAQGNYVQAEGYFQEGLTLARQIGHREWISALLINIGLTARKRGHYTQAKEFLQESLTLARQTGRPYIISNALYEYGNLCLYLQQVEAAAESFREMFPTIPEGGQDLLALAQYGLARVAAAQGNVQEARKLGIASLTALETMGHRYAQEARGWLDSIEGSSSVESSEESREEW